MRSRLLQVTVADHFAALGQLGNTSGIKTCLGQVKRNDWYTSKEVFDERQPSSAALWSVRSLYADQQFCCRHRCNCGWRMLGEQQFQVETPPLEGH